MSAAPLHPGERLARATLRKYGLPAGQPPADVLDTIEANAGVPVLIERFGAEEIAGVLLRHADEESFIAINADLHPVRQRFTLAHEWGHVEAGHTPRVEYTADVAGNPSDPKEIEANYFAAELLAPRTALKEWLAEQHPAGEPDAPTVAALAMHFGIALPAACYRLERAGLIGPARKEQLLSELHTNGRTYLKRLERRRLIDSLEQLAKRGAYPRRPAIMGDYATQALDSGLLDRSEYEQIMGIGVDLDAWLT